MAYLRRALAFLRAFLSGPSVLDTETGRLFPKIAGSAEETDEVKKGEKPEGEVEKPDGEEVEKPDDTPTKTAEEYRRELRTYERTSKKASKAKDEEIASLKGELKKHRDADKSEHEKAVEKAREEARAEALSEAEKERRSDRLDVAVTRAASKSFADPEDALIHIQRRIRSGEIDESEVFDADGKVQTESLKSALEQLLEDKPHLSADDGRPAGSADGGRGSGGGDSLEEMSMDEHLKRVQRK